MGTAKLTWLAPAGGLLLLILSGCAWCAHPLGHIGCPPGPDEAHQADATARGNGVCRTCGRPTGSAPSATPPAGATLPEGYYNHPRFHPVPTQPVFGSPVGPAAAVMVQPQLPLPDDNPHLMPDRAPTPPLLPAQPHSPAVSPTVPAPVPAQPSAERTGTPPKLLDTAASPDASTWLFSPSMPASALQAHEPSVAMKVDTSATSTKGTVTE